MPGTIPQPADDRIENMTAKGAEDGVVADAPRGNWVDRFLPASWRPYARLARLDRPIGWWLLLWPCWWSAALAINWIEVPFPVPIHLVLFLIGSIVMRGAGCTYNDIVDRKIDAEVARTRSRPIPSGQVSVRGAVIFLTVQLLIGLLVLVQFNVFTILLGFGSLGVVVIYPFLKRFTNWPQLGLGLAFSWGALMGWSALFGDIFAPQPLLLYAGCIFWVIGYDTIYAHQDKEDDALVGVHSTALFFGERTKPFLAVCYAMTTVLFALAFWTGEAETISFIGLAIGAAQLAWQVATLKTDDPDSCLRVFRSNRLYGWIIFLSLVVDAIATAHDL